jgi:hypothetical protein
MAKGYAKKSPSRRRDRAASSESLQALEKRVVAIAEQLGRIAATAQANAEHWTIRPGFYSELSQIRKRASRLLKRLGTEGLSTNGNRQRARERSRQKVAAPGKKHRKAPKAVHGVKHSDEVITKALTTQRRRSSRPREG